MTSANLSLSNRLSNHKKYITRTLWTSIIGYLLMALYYILGTVVMVSRSINYGRIYHQTSEVMHHEMINAVTKILGFEQLGWVLVMAMAIAFAFQGFSYVFEQKKLDFYMSQPTTRAQRIRKNYVNAITTFLFMYISINAIALIIAAIMGAMNSVILVTALIETIRMVVLFFTMYNITVLAILLCGSMPISMLVLAFFMIVSSIYAYLIQAFKSAFYATYAYMDSEHVLAAPLFAKATCTRVLVDLSRGTNWYNTSVKSVFEALSYVKEYEVDIFITGLVAFVFVIIFSKFRKAEHAGKAIVYRPFRWVLKIVICILAGLGCGSLFYSMNDYVWNNGPKFYAFMVAVMLIGTVLCGCIIEAILDGNIKSFIKGKAQTVMALAVVALIFVIFKGDLLGYDSYIPDKNKVESCALLGSDYSVQLYVDGDFSQGDDCAEDYMFITDIDSFNQLTKLGMATQKQFAEGNREGRYTDLGWPETALYRLKSGKMVYRQICIPYDMDEKILSSIVDSDEYKNGHFIYFHDEQFRDYDVQHGQTRVVQYTSAGETQVNSGIPYAEISDAYRKDVLEHYSFEMARDTRPIGEIQYDNNTYSGYASCSFSIFENYSNTIALLKEYGINTDIELDLDHIESIEVTNFYPGHNMENMSDEEIEDMYLENIESKSFYYTDKVQIGLIMESVCCTDYANRWYRALNEENNQFSVVVNARSSTNPGSFYTVYYSFKAGKVPDFVYSDTE